MYLDGYLYYPLVDNTFLHSVTINSNTCLHKLANSDRGFVGGRSLFYQWSPRFRLGTSRSNKSSNTGPTIKLEVKQPGLVSIQIKLTSKQANNHRSLPGVFVLPVGCPPLLYLVLSVSCLPFHSLLILAPFDYNLSLIHI